MYKRLQVERTSEKRIEHYIEAYKDNTIVHHALAQIEAKQDVGKNIDRIQKIIDEHPYNFSYGFLVAWIKLRDELPMLPPEKGVKVLMDKFSGTERLHLKKYLLEVLCMKPKEIEELLSSLKGTMDTEEYQEHIDRHL